MKPLATVPSQNPLSPTAFNAALLAAVGALGQELAEVRQEAGTEVAARLAAADDELAAIHEEVRQQQAELQELLAGGDRAATVRRFLAALPLVTVSTTSAGQVIEANAAALEALRAPPVGLLGKPIFTLITPADRRELRTALAAAVAGDDPVKVTVSLLDRAGGGELHAHLTLVREQGRADGHPPAVTVRWVIVVARPGTDPVAIPTQNQFDALAELCALGGSGADLRSSLQEVVRLCVQALPELDGASILLGNPLEPSQAVASSAQTQALDGLQHVTAAGPSFEAYRRHRPVMGTGGAGSTVLALPLLVTGRAAGVFTLYGRDRLDTSEWLRQVMPFVEAAQSLIRDTHAYEEMRRTQEQLEAALISRALIDQAKGMIMITLKCDADEAFNHLVRISGTRREKVRAVAQQMLNDALAKRPGGPVARKRPGSPLS